MIQIFQGLDMLEFTKKFFKGKRHPLLHRQTMMFKGWLRVIHQHCSRLQRYIDEFCCRFKRLKSPDNIFDTLVKINARSTVNILQNH